VALAVSRAQPAVLERRGRALAALVLVAGTGSMATEICASRLLAPFYGSSTVVWANVIGLVLAALAAGYWLGGKLADRRPTERALGTVVLAAALATAAVPFVARPFLDLSVRGLDRLDAGSVIGSFFASLVLFAPPVLALGAVAPYAIRLAVVDLETAGAVAGRIFALSTAGSLLGTFLPALVTIPLVGTQRTLLGAAALLALGSAFLLGRPALVAAFAVALLLALPPGAVKAGSGLLYEAESPYQYVRVVQAGPARELYLNEGVAVHSIWRPDTVLTGGEWDMFLAVPPLLGRPLRRVAILGNAGGTTARALGVFYPRARVDGIELDPVAAEEARSVCGVVLVGDLESVQLDLEPGYDLVLMADVVEHLREPVRALEKVKPLIRPGGHLLVSTPNIANWAMRLLHLAGRWDYHERGILDWTHLRFFTLRTLKRTVESAGYRVVEIHVTVPLPVLRREPFNRLAHWLGLRAKNLLAYQFIVDATPV
jgi:SAM-dependent methyltransferase